MVQIEAASRVLGRRKRLPHQAYKCPVATGEMLGKKLAIEWIFLNPVEAAADEEELFVIDELELHVNLVALQQAVESQLAG
jgi:hypothetical protein